jgi:hypothetical protein
MARRVVVSQPTSSNLRFNTCESHKGEIFLMGGNVLVDNELPVVTLSISNLNLSAQSFEGDH